MYLRIYVIVNVQEIIVNLTYYDMDIKSCVDNLSCNKLSPTVYIDVK